ncbi:MAG TPA: ribosome-associated translation inhibitor RaiA [Noviherbaspirillum sp.]
MNLTISGHHLDLTPAIREYVETKLERIRRHFDHVIDVAVILAVEKLAEKDKRQRAEITLRLRGKDLHAESIAEDLYAAIDTLIDKLDRQVMKHKTRVQDHQHEAIKRMPDASAAP